MSDFKELVSDLKLGETLFQQAEESSKFCDVVIVYGPPDDMKQIWAHWCVLVQCPYFEAMFRCGLQEKQQGKIFITESLHEEAVSAVIGFLYKGEVNLEYRLIGDVLNAADYFQFGDLHAVCKRDLLTVPLTKENCVELLTIAGRYNFEDLQTRSMTYITNNLIQIIEHPANSKAITDMMMIQIWDKANRDKKCQMTLFNFCRTWLCYDVNNRKQSFEKLFCSLNLNETTHEFFQSLSYDYVQTFKICRLFYVHFNSQNFQTRLTFTADTIGVVLLVAKIPQLQKSGGIYAYAIGSERWSFLTRLPRELREFDYYKYCIGVDPPGKFIYVIRKIKHNLSKHSAVLEIPTHRYDCELNTWAHETYKLNIKNERQVSIVGIVCDKTGIFLIAETVLRKRRCTNVQLLACREDTTLVEVALVPNICKRWYGRCDIKYCVVGDSSIIVLCIDIGQRTIKISVTNTNMSQTNICKTIKESHIGYNAGFAANEMLYTNGTCGIISRFGSEHHREVSISPVQCTAVEGEVLPRYRGDEEGLQLDNFVTGNGENVVSVYDKRTQTLRVINCITKEQHDAPPFPYDFQDCTLVHANMAARLLKCRIDCPHCLFEIKSDIH
ncbi:uncharacterized protein LOC127860580 isoform X1 [Dreissena polymorpha]|uniref:BTB domain-containing protein n=1 Tax=Dreissena polymorpha TaxID=45954 RepID=A0A9D3YIY5_DREPO|nr:uncharacterized protein LOC127860580 isoform X1 [Dreissena polymorpha]KAH3699341.1 hypothetical protein DPMN_074297 [Dreissena polymorpha]